MHSRLVRTPESGDPSKSDCSSPLVQIIWIDDADRWSVFAGLIQREVSAVNLQAFGLKLDAVRDRSEVLGVSLARGDGRILDAFEAVV